MNMPWQSKDAVYVSIAVAELAITNAGYVRDNSRHIWVHPGTRQTAKVIHTDNDRTTFSVQWG